MKVISVIEDEVVIKKILKHLGLWPVESLKVEREMKPRPPPKPTQPTKIAEYSIDYSTSQLPMPARRPCGGSDNLSRASRSNDWLFVDLEYPEGNLP